tara:strand:+ start:328 stop:549 length:222 start_codon:yes stop_codon:yes gene_type:complete
MKKIIKDRIKVNSAAIKLAEYNYETSELKLTFTNNSEYIYKSVEPFMFEGMRNAESIGKFINKYIKPLTFIKL